MTAAHRFFTRFSTLVAMTAFVAACSEGGDDTNAIDFARPDASEITSEVTTDLVMTLPITTTISEATNHFLQGTRALDMARGAAGHAHFMMAIGLDPTMAIGHLRAAETAPSFELFRTHLDLAEQHASNATPAEQLLIRYRRSGFDRNRDAQLEIATELVAMLPESPRALLTLASIQSTLTDHGAARASISEAIGLAPANAGSHITLGISYLNAEPRDFDMARQHMEHAVDLEPDEQFMHDNLGDVLRAMNDLEGARDAYTKAHELDLTNASPLQQRGHVHSFMGDFGAARADYDQAIARARGNQQASFVIWRSYVNLHEGDPQAAITELEELLGNVDAMDIPEPLGQKIGIISNIANIAMHTEDFDKAADALTRRTSLMNEQAAEADQADFTRGQQANIAYFDGWLAASQGDTEAARAIIQEYRTLVEDDDDPRKMEGVHEIMGLISMNQGNPAEAVGHFEQGNTGNFYIRYLIAKAHAAAGNDSEADQLFDELSIHNFNGLGFALARNEILARH